MLFVENAVFRRILTRLFLKSYANGRGSNPPALNALLGTPLDEIKNYRLGRANDIRQQQILSTIVVDLTRAFIKFI